MAVYGEYPIFVQFSCNIVNVKVALIFFFNLCYYFSNINLAFFEFIVLVKLAFLGIFFLPVSGFKIV